MRPNTLDEPPAPPLCRLFKMYLTTIQFFSISVMTKIYSLFTESLKCPPNSILKMTAYAAIAGVMPWEKIFHVAHQCH
jgi:hypothetical protein